MKVQVGDLVTVFDPGYTHYEVSGHVLDVWDEDEAFRIEVIETTCKAAFFYDEITAINGRNI